MSAASYESSSAPHLSMAAVLIRAPAGGLVSTATSSEAADALGDGRTSPDIVVTGNVVTARAERSGTGVGRTCTIIATATDLAGNTTRKTSTCVVPHDR